MAVILDSGNRTTFNSGAVRDMKENKGRCDLLPLSQVAHLTGIPELVLLDEYQQTKNVTDLYGCLRVFAKAHFEDMETMMLEVSEHFRDGAKKYGEYNWQKGIPEWSYIDSAVRHRLKLNRGDDDERHDRAFVWNVLCLIWTAEQEKAE